MWWGRERTSGGHANGRTNYAHGRESHEHTAAGAHSRATHASRGYRRGCLHPAQAYGYPPAGTTYTHTTSYVHAIAAYPHAPTAHFHTYAAATNSHSHAGTGGNACSSYSYKSKTDRYPGTAYCDADTIASTTTASEPHDLDTGGTLYHGQ